MAPVQTILIATGAGAVAGVLAAMFISNPAAGMPESLPNTDSSALVQQILELEQQNLELSNRVALLEDAPVAVQRNTDEPNRAEQGGLQTKAGPDSITEDAAAGRTGQGFDGAVIAVIEQREQARLDEKEREAAKHRAASVQRTADYWQDQLNLDRVQADQMYDLLLARTEGHRQLKLDWQAGGESVTLGETKGAIEQTFNDGMSNLLTPIQLETYQASNSRKR